jgi:hypothetical protein
MTVRVAVNDIANRLDVEISPAGVVEFLEN